jgi:hypothetical protein
VLRQLAKKKSLSLSSLQRSIARQESSILWLKEGYTPTSFFHAHTNSRRRRNHIRTLEQEGHVLVAEERKDEVAYQFYDEVLGTAPSRAHAINLQLLDISKLNLSKLGERFTEAEVWQVIRSLSPDKSPGPDGFTARFLQVVWQVIKAGLMSAFVALWHLDARGFHFINDTLITLLLKGDSL